MLAQVVHTPVLAFGQRIAEIQANFLAAGYPFFARQDMTQINIDLAAGGIPKLVTQPRWDFIDRDRTHSVSITESSLVLAAHHYTRYEAFATAMERALGLVEPYAVGAVVERLGLRYLDFVRPQKGEQLKQYLKTEILGFDFQGIPIKPDALRNFRTEAVAATALGQLAIRCYQLPPGQVLPPDLAVGTPLGGLAQQGIGSNRPASGVSLDFDHFTDKKFDYQKSLVLDRLRSLQEVLGIAFRQTITPHAWKTWGPIEAEAKA